MKSFLAIFSCFLSLNVVAQIFGPNPPTLSSNLGTGNSWLLGDIFLSNNIYSSVNTRGITQSLVGSAYGFALTSSDNITGIRLEVEKKGTAYNDVSILNAWRDGYNATISNFTLSAGVNRMMLVTVAAENGTSFGTFSVTYGGLSMTKLTSVNANTGFEAQLEMYYLPESSLNTLSPGNYNVVLSSTAFTQTEYFNILSAAVYQNVDPLNPFAATVTGSVNGSTPNPWSLSSAMSCTAGSAAITSVFSGQNTTPASTEGGTGTWTINSSFTETIDVYRSNTTCCATSGGCLQVAHKFKASSGSEQPAFTFNGSANRRVQIGLVLRRAEIHDNSVRLLKLGIPTGNDYATSTFWSTSDAVSTYGGPGDLWGTTWTWTDVNNPLFGSAISAMLYNGRAEVDQKKITIYTTSVLPIELQTFYAEQINQNVHVQWVTATEINSRYFVVERSDDGYQYQQVGFVEAAGNSQTWIDYAFDDHPGKSGVYYYRLKAVDLDGTVEWTDPISVQFTSNGLPDQLYPNPAENWVTLTSASPINEVQLLDQAGRLLGRYSGMDDTQFKMDLSQFPDGKYFIYSMTEEKAQLQSLSKQSKSIGH